MSKAIRNVYPAKGNSVKHSIIIVAAGYSYRMKSYGPPSLIQPLKPQKTETLLDRQLAWIKKNFPQNEIILVGGFEVDKLFNNVPDHIIKVENERYEATNMVRSVALGLRASTTSNVVILNGDLYFKNIKISLTKQSCIITCDELMPKGEVGCIINKGILANIMYDLPTKWSQICYLTGKELKKFKELCFNRDNEQKYTYEIINEMVESDYEFCVISPKGFWCIDIDSIKDIKAIQKYERTNNI